MKRVALFSITYHPFIGGAEIAIKEFTDRITDVEFDLFTARLNVRLPQKERIGNVNVYRLGSGRSFLDKLLFPWRASRLAIQLHSQRSYDLIHAIMATYAGWAALKFKDKIPSVPYLLTLQSGDSDEFIKKRTWFWERRYSEIYTKADKITAISNWLKDRAQKYGYKKDVEIIPNGVDIEKFDIEISKEERDSIRGSWGASESDIVLITTSRLVHKNGIDTLIDNMRLFPQNVKLVIAGEGEEEKKLREQANEFGDRVKFLRNVEHDKIPKLLKSADMFFRLSRSEGMGNSFVEAKAAGLLVVGTDVGGIKDLISQEIVLEYDTSRVSSVIKQIKNNPDIYNKLRDSGKDKVKELFNWNNISNQYNKEYKKLIL